VCVSRIPMVAEMTLASPLSVDQAALAAAVQFMQPNLAASGTSAAEVHHDLHLKRKRAVAAASTPTTAQALLEASFNEPLYVTQSDHALCAFNFAFCLRSRVCCQSTFPPAGRPSCPDKRLCSTVPRVASILLPSLPSARCTVWLW
jgi:hypothetical protein